MKLRKEEIVVVAAVIVSGVFLLIETAFYVGAAYGIYLLIKHYS